MDKLKSIYKQLKKYLQKNLGINYFEVVFLFEIISIALNCIDGKNKKLIFISEEPPLFLKTFISILDNFFAFNIIVMIAVILLFLLLIFFLISRYIPGTGKKTYTDDGKIIAYNPFAAMKCIKKLTVFIFQKLWITYFSILFLYGEVSFSFANIILVSLNSLILIIKIFYNVFHSKTSVLSNLDFPNVEEIRFNSLILDTKNDQPEYMKQYLVLAVSEKKLGPKYYLIRDMSIRHKAYYYIVKSKINDKDKEENTILVWSDKFEDIKYAFENNLKNNSSV